MMMKKFLTIAASVAIATTLFGCAGNQESSPDYADDEAMAIIAKGWNQRSDILGDITTADPEYTNTLKKSIQAEIDTVSPLKDRQFEDTELQEDVIAYLNSLSDQMEILDNYSITDPDYYTKWQKSFDDRTILLKTFADEYGLTVDPKYQTIFDDLLANGSSAQNKNEQKTALDSLIASATWDKTEEYGLYNYTAIVENTTDFNYLNVGLVVNLYDADGVKTESYANVSNWNKGEKVKFEVGYSQVDASRVDAVVQYYDVAD